MLSQLLDTFEERAVSRYKISGFRYKDERNRSKCHISAKLAKLHD